MGEIDVFPSPGRWFCFALGLAGWAFIINEIFNGESGGNANGCSAAVATAFNNMRQIVTVGWSIYPLGYLFGYLLNSVDETFLNVIYNIADLSTRLRLCCPVGLVPRPTGRLTLRERGQTISSPTHFPHEVELVRVVLPPRRSRQSRD